MRRGLLRGILRQRGQRQAVNAFRHGEGGGLAEPGEQEDDRARPAAAQRAADQQVAADMAEALGVVTGVPVETYDERLTTVSAHRVLREQGVAGPDRKDVVDKVAAAVLLQAWLDGRQAANDDASHQR